MPYALHEALEAHELAAFKTICMTKSKTMDALVSDKELKAILRLDVDLSTRHLEELKMILQRACEQELGGV